MVYIHSQTLLFENEYYIYSLFPSPINSEFLVIVGDKDRNSEENQFVILINLYILSFMYIFIIINEL